LQDHSQILQPASPPPLTTKFDLVTALSWNQLSVAQRTESFKTIPTSGDGYSQRDSYTMKGPLLVMMVTNSVSEK